MNNTANKIESLVPGVSTLEHWKETAEFGVRRYCGEFCAPDEIVQLRALVQANREMEVAIKKVLALIENHQVYDKGASRILAAAISE